MMYFKYRSICITEYYHIWDCLKFRRNINLFCHSMHNSKPHYLSSLKRMEKNFWCISNHHLEWFYCLYGVNIIVVVQRKLQLRSKTHFTGTFVFFRSGWKHISSAILSYCRYTRSFPSNPFSISITL